MSKLNFVVAYLNVNTLAPFNPTFHMLDRFHTVEEAKESIHRSISTDKRVRIIFDISKDDIDSIIKP